MYPRKKNHTCTHSENCLQRTSVMKEKKTILLLISNIASKHKPLLLEINGQGIAQFRPLSSVLAFKHQYHAAKTPRRGNLMASNPVA